MIELVEVCHQIVCLFAIVIVTAIVIVFCLENTSGGF